MVEGLTLGMIDGGLIGGGSFQSIDERFGIEALPYAWPTHEAAYKAFDGKLGEFLFKLLNEKGIEGLAWWENGFRHITNNKKPIVKPEDLKGLKIRVTPDKMRLDTFKLLGAAPMAINFGELYSALQQGVRRRTGKPLRHHLLQRIQRSPEISLQDGTHLGLRDSLRQQQYMEPDLRRGQGNRKAARAEMGRSPA